MARKNTPPLRLLLMEGQRAALEGLSVPPASLLLARAPRGDGMPVLVLPGFMASDTSTRVLRRYLMRQDYSAHAWRLGRNVGPRDGVEEKMLERVETLSERFGAPVSIIGWSLGGIYARELAKKLPHRVKQVITLGSPFADISRGSHAKPFFDLLAQRGERRRSRTGQAANPPRARRRPEDIAVPPDVPSTAIFTKTDGVVHWENCLEPDAPHTENIEISGSHCGLGMNPTVLYAIAERLSQPAGNWRPFEVRGWRRLLYRTH